MLTHRCKSRERREENRRAIRGSRLKGGAQPVELARQDHRTPSCAQKFNGDRFQCVLSIHLGGAPRPKSTTASYDMSRTVNARVLALNIVHRAALLPSDTT